MITPTMLVFQGYPLAKIHDMTWFKTCPTCKTHDRSMNQAIVKKDKGVNKCKFHLIFNDLGHAFIKKAWKIILLPCEICFRELIFL